MKDFRNLEPMEYFRIPWRRHWYFLATAVLVIVGAWIYARLRPNLYRSETRILVESATLLDVPCLPLTRTELKSESMPFGNSWKANHPGKSY
jgi:uncharacterized protein involved in exopolysaccharide biosynthesis